MKYACYIVYGVRDKGAPLRSQLRLWFDLLNNVKTIPSSETVLVEKPTVRATLVQPIAGTWATQNGRTGASPYTKPLLAEDY